MEARINHAPLKNWVKSKVYDSTNRPKYQILVVMKIALRGVFETNKASGEFKREGAETQQKMVETEAPALMMQSILSL